LLELEAAKTLDQILCNPILFAIILYFNSVNSFVGPAAYVDNGGLQNHAIVD